MTCLKRETRSRQLNSRRGPKAEEAISTSENFLKVLVDPSVAKIDIVAVHGLNPLGRTSHAESTWTADGKLWLRDFLKHQAPQARVLLFGYNSRVAFDTAKAGVREHAENWLNRLAAERIVSRNLAIGNLTQELTAFKDDPDRPLLFVCHSLGGLVVKRAMVHAKGDETYQKIWASTFGIVERHSVYLNTINDDFRTCLEDFEFISFFETRNFGPFRALVVEPESATLGLMPEREKQLGLDANHSQICKFESEEDPRYKQVESNIIHLINKAITAGVRLPKGQTTSFVSNVASIIGAGNTTAQVGSANEIKTDGNDNETR
ncbi:MAG: Serine active site containing protein 1 [Trizodia sp. TS-e1964]|nr:MAG: Serine active site containing protein 1 [Trizodia sp. TS-e1964]